MATFNWSTLTNGQTLTFNPALDVLVFDDPTISAAAIQDWIFTASNSGSIGLRFANKTVTLSTALASLTTANVVFADGSQLLIGDNTTAVGNGTSTNDDAANTLTGTANADAIFGLGGSDALNGGDGNDTFVLAFGTAPFGNDTIDGGAGFDTLIYNGGSTNAASVNLATHTATNAQGSLSITSIETVLGTAGADTFIGGDAAHAIDALGNPVTERFRGNAGNDTIVGGADNGLTSFFTVADYANNSNAQAITVNLRLGSASSDGRGGVDTLTNVDGVRGGAAADTLTGGSLARSLNGVFFELFRGGAGNDTIDGGNSFSDGENASTDRADYSNNTAAQAINANLVTGSVSDGLGGVDTLIGIDQIHAGAGNDTILGGTGDESFDGGAGNDAINGGLGEDEARFIQSTAAVVVNLSAASITVGAITVAAGTANDGMGGTDTLTSIEIVRGSDFNDHIRGSDDTNIVEEFRGAAGNDTIDGGAGVDFASYSNTARLLGGITAFIENGAGSVNDLMGGTDTLTNIEGLRGTNMGDSLSGGLGDQWFAGSGGNDTLNGGAGNDGVVYAFDPTGVSVNLVTGIATDGYNGAAGLLALGGVDALISIENVVGSDFADTITGNAANNFLLGEQGNDTIWVGGGADEIDGFEGNDVIDGGEGNDTLQGGDGDDRLTGRIGSDVIFGGAGTADRFVTAFVETSFTVTGVAGAYTFTSLVNGDIVQVNEVEQYEIGGVVTAAPINPTYTVYGGATAGADVIVTGAVDDQINGQAGSDTIYSQGGHDQVTAGLGNDLLVLGAGRDTGIGGDGNDTIYGGDDADVLTSGIGVDVLSGGNGNDVLYGGDDTDYIYGDGGTNLLFGDGGVDVIYAQGTNDIMYGGADSDYFYPFPGAVAPTAYGGEGNDIYTDLSGGAGSNDTFYGENGADYFYGFGGNDTMYAGDGVDVFLGGAGNDTFDGMTGTDYAWGDTGDDTFVTSNANGYLVISDFTAGGTEDSVRLVGTGITSFAQVQASLSYYAGINTTILTIDADTNVWLVGVTIPTLTASDFTFV